MSKTRSKRSPKRKQATKETDELANPYEPAADEREMARVVLARRKSQKPAPRVRLRQGEG